MGRGYAAAKARRQAAGATNAGQGALSDNEVRVEAQVIADAYQPNTPKDAENIRLLRDDKALETMTDAKFMEVTDSGLKRASSASKYGVERLESNSESLNQQWSKRAEQVGGILQRLESLRKDVFSKGNVSISDRKAFARAIRVTGDAAVRLRVMGRGSNTLTERELRRQYRLGTETMREAQAFDRSFSRRLRATD